MLAALPSAGVASHLIAQHPTRLPPVDGSKHKPATTRVPVTDFSIERFERAIQQSLVTPFVGTSAPETGFDLNQFERSVDQSLDRLIEQQTESNGLGHPKGVPTDTNSPIDPPIFADQGVPAKPAAVLMLQHEGIGLPENSMALSMPERELPITNMAAPPTVANLSDFSDTPGVQPASPDSCYQHPMAANYHGDDFSPTPIDAASTYHDGMREAWVYDSKRDVPTQRPWIEWPRRWYSDGITPKGLNWWGEKNLVRPKMYLYGDYRTGIIGGRNAAGRTDNWAHRLNLDLDLQLTDTERFHTFFGPLDNNGQFTRFQLVDGDVQFREEINFTPVTGFFEGDLGVMLGAAQNRTSPFELPVTIGLIPLLFQNGIWMEDALTGAAFSIPGRHSRLLNISNMDTTFFAAVDQLNSPAFDGASAAQVFGVAAFIEAYGGYIETGYAYLNDRNNDDRDYHNATFSYTRRYFDRISNSVRVIVNAGQDAAKADRTADGTLLLVENSWITASPLTFVPYANFFVGWDRPQSVARAAGSGGVLRNTGVNFDTDGLNGFANLDATGADTAGGAIGVDLIGDDLDKQLIVEAAWQTPHGSANPNVPDDQFAIGSRIQFNLSNATLVRFDVMHGWRRGLEDVYGTRMEYRWKF